MNKRKLLRGLLVVFTLVFIGLFLVLFHTGIKGTLKTLVCYPHVDPCDITMTPNKSISIYQNGIVVKNVITDKNGNFQTNLKPGEYIIDIPRADVVPYAWQSHVIVKYGSFTQINLEISILLP